MINLNDFISQWDGKYCEIAGSPQNQCVDLANQYIRDVLGLPIIEWANAIDFPSKAGDKYDYIVNNPNDLNQVPTRGDLVIWKPSPGHIAIYLDKIDDNRFHSFDENFPLFSVCHIQEHNYTNVLGWLHCKVTPQSDTIPVLKTDFENLVKKATEDDAFNALGYGTPKELQQFILQLQGQLKTSRDMSNQFENLAGQTQAKLTALQAKYDQLASTIVSPPPQPNTAPCEKCLETLTKIRPLVNSGWITYLRSRNLIQNIVYA